MPASMPIPWTEGTIDFDHPTLPHPAQTWYRIKGNVHDKAGIPLLVIHGGPGFTHHYLLPLAKLATDRPVIFYDQIGSGLSTHYREKKGDAEFWSVALWLAELENIIEKLGLEAGTYDLLGQSWGGMLAAEFAIRRQPRGLRRLVLSSTPADMGLWLEGVWKMRRTLPQDLQETLDNCEKNNNTHAKEYKAAMNEYFKRFLSRRDPFPQELMDSIDWARKDDTVPKSALGTSEFYITGSFRDWSILGTLHHINVPTFLINGKYDEAQDMAVAPFFWGIPKVKWVTLAESAHLPHLDEPEAFLELVREFLTL